MRERGHSWSQVTVSAVETGQRGLSFAEGLDLAELYGVEPRGLMGFPPAESVDSVLAGMRLAQDLLAEAVAKRSGAVAA